MWRMRAARAYFNVMEVELESMGEPEQQMACVVNAYASLKHLGQLMDSLKEPGLAHIFLMKYSVFEYIVP